MAFPDPELVKKTYLAIRQRHAAERSRDDARMDEEHRYWERTPPLERRVGWRAAG
jgi:hypothetical protein